MGNFEKLSVLVIVVIIVMILVVAIYEWTGSPSSDPTTPDPTTTSKVDDPGAQGTRLSSTDGTVTGNANDDIRKMFELYNPPAITPSVPPVAGPPGSTAKGAAAVTPPGPGAGAPNATPTPASTPSGAEFPETTHVVAAGESLSEIAHKHWKRASYYTKIVDVNPGLDPMRLRVGQKLKIPALTMEAPASGVSGGERIAASEGGSRPKPGDEYTVRAGDTWESISRRVYDTSERWPEIYMRNMNKTGMKDLRKGVVLLLPK